MACPTCGLSVMFGGIKDGDKKYCSKKCHEAGAIDRYSETVPESIVHEYVHKIRNGNCPECGERSVVDIHKSYSIYSIIITTSYQTHEHMTCKKCAQKSQLTHIISSFLLGWWGNTFRPAHNSGSSHKKYCCHF